ncbi:hypothetical protein K457DRAFT_135359 [Linnemannia elongata AG-77]|uniref:BZIP domain-containing protein n=1 Tax=Linnemannia elongata AG-77 TaxID=1314771 RepID=A0A197K477_9FUNG|nr:hypothetical protein K457DRAFT_135359 [Linnemannia elongata AG-77]
MTSKERRQLRNKISARNFRVRRKGEWTVIDVGENPIYYLPFGYIHLCARGKDRRGKEEQGGDQKKLCV